MQDAIVIVNGFNAARFFPPSIRAKGFRCIHLCTANMAHAAVDLSEYDLALTNEVAYDILIRTLRDASVIAVIPGSESGVELA